VTKEILPRYGDFLNFQNGGGLHLEFFNFEILVVRRVKMIKLHQYTKFCGNQSNAC